FFFLLPQRAESAERDIESLKEQLASTSKSPHLSSQTHKATDTVESLLYTHTPTHAHTRLLHRPLELSNPPQTGGECQSSQSKALKPGDQGIPQHSHTHTDTHRHTHTHTDTHTQKPHTHTHTHTHRHAHTHTHTRVTHTSKDNTSQPQRHI